MKHVHRLHPTWLLVTGLADAQGWYRVILWARCTQCGMEGAFAAEQRAVHKDGRLLQPGE